MEIVAEIDPVDLKPGANYLRQKGHGLIVHVSEDRKTIQACLNRCPHQGGLFAQSDDIEDAGTCVAKCRRHGWKLDLATMQFVVPSDLGPAQQLHVHLGGSGLIELQREPKDTPWNPLPRQQELQPGELTVTYLSHACVEIKAGGVSLITDPWLLGPAFLQGWWLQHKPPADVWERLSRADAVWLSHSHPDHENYHTLKVLAEQRPSIPIYVGDLPIPVIRPEVAALGFSDVRVVPIGEWVRLGGVSFMVLSDECLPAIDTWMLLEYKGHCIANFVDCSAPSGFEVPDSQVDLVLSDFASGSSAYPSMYGDVLGDRVGDMVKSKRRTFVNKTVEMVRKTGARAFVPIAGYFVEAYPGDAVVRSVNVKNTPGEVASAVSSRVGAATWVPYPGGSFDVGLLRGEDAAEGATYDEDSWDFERYIGPIKEASQFGPLQAQEGLQSYFRWAGFEGYDMVLWLTECSDDFSETVRDFWVDFANGARVVVGERVPEGRRYFRMRVRSTSFRYVLLHGASWDDLIIGFQAHCSEHPPNTYYREFLYHFQHGLPRSAPDFAP